MQNIVILAGNIGQKPETRTTQGGTNITNFSLATSRPRISEGRVLRDENGYRVHASFSSLSRKVAPERHSNPKGTALVRPPKATVGAAAANAHFVPLSRPLANQNAA